MILKTFAPFAAGLTLALFGAAASADDKAPMPQTRGMQGMDPKLHDQPAKDPYAGCMHRKTGATTDAGMPQTRGMQGMGPKAHEMDCPENPADSDSDVSKQQHMHKVPGTGN